MRSCAGRKREAEGRLAAPNLERNEEKRKYRAAYPARGNKEREETEDDHTRQGRGD